LTQGHKSQRHLRYVTLPLAAGLIGLILFNAFHGFHSRRTGFPVHIASDTCSCVTDDSVIFLHISSDGMTINSETVSRKNLAALLSDIYRPRAEKVLYLAADDDVSFQAVADVIETVRHLPESRTSGVPLPHGLEESVSYMNVGVELVTRRVVDAPRAKNCINLAKQPFPIHERLP